MSQACNTVRGHHSHCRIAAVHLWQQLRAERELTAQLRARPEASTTLASGQLLPTGGVPAGSPAVVATALHPQQACRARECRQLRTGQCGEAQNQCEVRPAADALSGSREGAGLTSEEAEAFYDLLMKQEADLRPAVLLRSLQGSNGAIDMRELQRRRTELEKTQAAELEAQLGPARSRQWQEYQKTVEARRRVNELTMTLSTTSPLTEEQSAPLLANVMAEHKRRTEEQTLRGPAPADPRGQLDYEEQTLKEREESNRRTLAFARSFLTQEQLAVMQASMTRANDNTRTTLQARRERLERIGTGRRRAGWRHRVAATIMAGGDHSALSKPGPRGGKRPQPVAAGVHRLTGSVRYNLTLPQGSLKRRFPVKPIGLETILSVPILRFRRRPDGHRFSQTEAGTGSVGLAQGAAKPACARCLKAGVDRPAGDSQREISGRDSHRHCEIAWCPSRWPLRHGKR